MPMIRGGVDKIGRRVGKRLSPRFKENLDTAQHPTVRGQAQLPARRESSLLDRE